MVSDNFTKYLTKYLRQRGLKNKLCPDGRWGKGPGRLVVQQMLLGLRLARNRDAVRQQLQYSYDGADCPTSLMEVMELQLDKFEVEEETLGVMAIERVMGKPSARATVSSFGKGGSAKAKHEDSSLGDSGTS